jgi:hypothetical protein
MNKPTGILRKLTATDLAAHLEGPVIPDGQRCESASPLRRVAPRLAFCASLLAGVVAHERSALAVLVDGSCGCSSPTSAFQTGYATGYSMGYVDGYNAPTHAPLSTGTNNADLQAAYNQGFNYGVTAGVAAKALGLPEGSLFDNTPPSDLDEDDLGCATCGCSYACGSGVSCGGTSCAGAACGGGGGCGGCG